MVQLTTTPSRPLSFQRYYLRSSLIISQSRDRKFYSRSYFPFLSHCPNVLCNTLESSMDLVANDPLPLSTNVSAHFFQVGEFPSLSSSVTFYFVTGRRLLKNATFQCSQVFCSTRALKSPRRILMYVRVAFSLSLVSERSAMHCSLFSRRNQYKSFLSPGIYFTSGH